jgi:hypothetical protein
MKDRRGRERVDKEVKRQEGNKGRKETGKAWEGQRGEVTNKTE